MTSAEHPKKQRPIDRLRDGAGSLEILTADDTSVISEMISTGERLLIVKGRGVYEVKLADQIDPGRTNIWTPNTVQRILPYGAEDPWVGATLLTAYHLLKASIAQNHVYGDEAFGLAIQIAKDISSAHQLHDSYAKAETDATEKLKPKIASNRSLLVPAIGNVEARCNEFLQRVDHALRELFRIAKMFYPDVGSGGWDALKKKVDSGPQDEDNFSTFLAQVVPFLSFIRNARNCVEHPRPEQRLVVTDFALDAKNVLLPPMVQVMHPKSPLDRTPVLAFFSHSLQHLSSVVELMIVFLCARHVKPVGGMPIQVVEMPPDGRKSPHVRYGYGALIGGELVPFS